MAANKNVCRRVWIDNEDRPRCSGHGEPMYWNKRASGPRGGYWRCAVKSNAAGKRARHTPGTFRFNAVHGIGIVGAKTNLGRRKRYRAVAEAGDQMMILRILAENPDLRGLVQ